MNELQESMQSRNRTWFILRGVKSCGTRKHGESVRASSAFIRTGTFSHFLVHLLEKQERKKESREKRERKNGQGSIERTLHLELVHSFFLPFARFLRSKPSAQTLVQSN